MTHLSNTPKFEMLYSSNYPSMYRKLEQYLKTWSKQNLSWLGKINAVKNYTTT